MYLITQSLLSAWGYMYTCPEACEEKAFTDFLKTLNREKTEPAEAMLNGREFEDDVYKAAETGYTSNEIWEPGIIAIANIIRGSQIQLKAKREITVDGMDFLVYGILDALKAGVIYDVKFTNKSIGSVNLAGKYRESPQHPAYFYIVPEAMEFQYLVSDGQDVYIERYTKGETPEIGGIIHEFIQAMREMDLLNTYKEKWSAL